jgi:hypothetical protein
MTLSPNPVLQLLLLVSLSALPGCTWSMAAKSAGQIGCPSSDIEISDYGQSFGALTWTAVCNGQTYYCSEHAASAKSTSQVSCTRANAESSSPAPSTSPTASSTSPERDSETQRTDYPEEALGFRFGMSRAEAEEACVAGGHEWAPAGPTFRCKGAPSAIGAETNTYVGFCGGELCLATLTARFEPEDATADKAFRKILNTLQVRYGTPRVSEPRIPQRCAKSVVRCTAAGDASWRARWVWSGRRFVLGELEPKDGHARLLVKYSKVPAGVALDTSSEGDSAEEIDTSAF